MNENEFDSKGLCEPLGMSVPEGTAMAQPPKRTLEMVTEDIKKHQFTLQRLGQLMLEEIIELGRCLEEAKAMLPHGQWGYYLEHEVEYSQSTAQNFMRLFREYGASQQNLFGSTVKSQAFEKLTYAKALQLLALPDAEEREQFMAEHDVESMSSRELKRVIKERDAAREEAAAAQKDAQDIRQEDDVFHLFRAEQAVTGGDG